MISAGSSGVPEVWEGFVEKVGFELGVKGMVWYGRV